MSVAALVISFLALMFAVGALVCVFFVGSRLARYEDEFWMKSHEPQSHVNVLGEALPPFDQDAG